MVHLKRIFGSMNRGYMIRSYLIAFIFYWFTKVFLAMAPEEQPPLEIPSMVYTVMIINSLVFPFAKLVWDLSKGYVMGNTIIIQSLPAYFFWKFYINGVIWVTALIFAPIGIIYLMFNSKSPHET